MLFIHRHKYEQQSFKRIEMIIMQRRFVFIVLGVCLLVNGGCDNTPWNHPYPAADSGKNILYSSFSERPKHLDPTSSYAENEAIFIGQIYEPPLQYHFLKRPYQLIPLTARSVPKPKYIDADGKTLPDDVAIERIAYSIYVIQLQSGIYYQPHPAFAKDATGKYSYMALTPEDLAPIDELSDFKKTGTRELIAADYIYQIKRLAHPHLHSPIFGMMSEYIDGLADYANTLKIAYNQQKKQRHSDAMYFDLTKYSLSGVKLIDRYTYSIRLKGKYPQFQYWLAMNFFVPMPPEADRFFSQNGMREKNLTLDWYPIGTGPYQLTKNNPNRKMVLTRNPNYRHTLYPDIGETTDQNAGYLTTANQPLPFIDEAIYLLEKEEIPYWNKFLQGYYDVSGINEESFDQAIRIGTMGDVNVSAEMRAKGIMLKTTVAASTSYFGFNMLDPIVGGYSLNRRKLRQAISIAIDYEEYISIFLNGRGIAAQGPIPAEIFGHIKGKAGINPYVYEWINEKPQRHAISVARKLLAEAGFPNGRNKETGEPLILNLDMYGAGPATKSNLDWMRKQFAKLNIQLNIRATDYNRFQEKMRKGHAQLFRWGWNADYPDPENFLFLLYGANTKAFHQGENASNYQNPEFDKLFAQMKNLDNGPQRQGIINRMLALVRRDAPWAWGFHPKSFRLQHSWVTNGKPNLFAKNALKYKRIDPTLRTQKRIAWNQPSIWPLAIIVGVIIICGIPAGFSYWKREHKAPRLEQ